MRFVKPDVEKERFLRIAFLVQPGDCLIHHKLAGVSLELPDSFPVAPEVTRVAMTWRGVQVSREPIIESVFVDPRFLHPAKRCSQMPLAEMNRIVTVRFQKLGNRHLAFAKVHVVNMVLNDRVDSRPQVMTPCEQCGSRWRANRSSRMKIGEADAFRSQLVQRWRLHRSAVTADVLRA